MCNKNGLFDEAKMFELFAKEVCKLIFNQDFINLNDLKPNYPFFDLVSIDKKIYVQVSTEQYIQTIDTLLTLPDLPRKIVPKVKNKQPIISKKKNKSGKQRVVDFSKWPTGDVVAKERRRRYGMESQITRKEWGSAYRPARIK